jgi:serine/threonine-protein kinase RsbT
VASVARIDILQRSVEVAAIGNVAVNVLRSSGASSVTRVVSVPAVLGSAYRPVRPETLVMEPGDAIVMHTDGVESRFDFRAVRTMDAQSAAEHVIRDGGKATDDAGCIVVQAFASESLYPRVAALRASSPVEAAGTTEALAVPIRIRGDAECVSNETRAFAGRLNMPLRAQWEVAIAASELATNVLKFASKGLALIRHETAPMEALVVEISDDGSGIPDVSAALVDGFSDNALLGSDSSRVPGKGLGVGLGTVHRLSDLVKIETEANRGTRITIWKFVRRA